MGTNYYFHPEVCERCRRSDPPIHIGKRSGGWQFSFQGFADVRSAADWRRVLSGAPALVDGFHLSGRGEIRDEDGAVYRNAQFWEMVQERRAEKLNHHDYCRLHHPESDTWKDSEGYAFSGGDFS